MSDMKVLKEEGQNNLVGGLILIGIGILALVAQFVNFGNLGIYFLLGLGLIFHALGVIRRDAGYFIPGGVLSGIGLGIVLVTSGGALGMDGGGLFMLAFAAGWVSVTVMSALFGEETHWWALIPAGIMALIGLGVSFGGLFLTVLSALGTWWPLFLIIAGISALWKSAR
jgi:hypothetical protein